MEFLQNFLPIVIDFLLIILIIFGIVLIFKIIITMNRVDKLVTNVENKVNSLNGLFNIIEATSGKITGIYSKVIDFASSLITKLFIKDKKRKDEEDE